MYIYIFFFKPALPLFCNESPAILTPSWPPTIASTFFGHPIKANLVSYWSNIDSTASEFALSLYLFLLFIFFNEYFHCFEMSRAILTPCLTLSKTKQSLQPFFGHPIKTHLVNYWLNIDSTANKFPTSFNCSEISWAILTPSLTLSETKQSFQPFWTSN